MRVKGTLLALAVAAGAGCLIAGAALAQQEEPSRPGPPLDTPKEPERGAPEPPQIPEAAEAPR